TLTHARPHEHPHEKTHQINPHPDTSTNERTKAPEYKKATHREAPIPENRLRGLTPTRNCTVTLAAHSQFTALRRISKSRSLYSSAALSRHSQQLCHSVFFSVVAAALSVFSADSPAVFPSALASGPGSAGAGDGSAGTGSGSTGNSASPPFALFWSSLAPAS